MRSALDLGSAPAGARLRKGITVGAPVGGVVGVPLLGLLLITGPDFVGRHGATLRLDLAAVLEALGATLGASVFAVGYPVVQHRRPARVLLALLAVLPWLVAFTVACNRGYDRWTRSHTLLTGISVLAFGVPLGWSAATHCRARRRARGRRPRAT